MERARGPLQAAIDTVSAYGRLWREQMRHDPPTDAGIPDRRLLLLVTQFAPSISGGVYRPAAIARHASDAQFRVTVLTHAAPAKPSDAGLKLLEYVGSGPTIHRLGAPSLQPSHRWFTNIDGSMVAALDLVREARRIFGEDLPKTVVATGPSFSTFVAGLLLTSNPSSKLVLDYRDEWTACPFDFVSTSRSDVHWEARCVARANTIVFTTEAQRAHCVETYGNLVAHKAHVVENGWEPMATSDEPSAPRGDQSIVLTFAGTLGAHTNPTRFLDTLARVLARRGDLASRLRVRFVGTKDEDVAAQLRSFPHAGVVELVPLVPLAEAVRLMRDSDALLLFHDARFARYLPGKLYEYIASGTKVLLFDDVGESSRLVESLGVGYKARSDDGTLLEKILDDLASLRASGKWPVPVSDNVSRWLDAHTREALARKFLALIE